MVALLFGIYLIFGRVVPWSLALTLIQFLGRRPITLKTVGLVMVVGLIEDVVTIHPLGTHAALMVSWLWLVGLLIKWYRSQWQWWFLLGGLGELAYRLWVIPTPVFWPFIGQLVTLFIVDRWSRRQRISEGIYVE